MLVNICLLIALVAIVANIPKMARRLVEMGHRKELIRLAPLHGGLLLSVLGAFLATNGIAVFYGALMMLAGAASFTLSIPGLKRLRQKQRI